MLRLNHSCPSLSSSDTHPFSTSPISSHRRHLLVLLASPSAATSSRCRTTPLTSSPLPLCLPSPRAKPPALPSIYRRIMPLHSNSTLSIHLMDREELNPVVHCSPIPSFMVAKLAFHCARHGDFGGCRRHRYVPS
ncbi:hypothetical protein E2562_022002 [Oryza meyeriana var. granulata]|uniref:Uncharacterized protein n=1 Tax=Oryza meyeriana var. granulata TaxID=110450 RepID=A0A6G1ENG1_9ORYZ|nr:hypothetical protein E2562_022002 [Oryza meyeriana var. granulata]